MNNKSSDIIISKFGGSSMASFQTMINCAQLIQNQKSNIVVLSAVYSTTDTILKLIDYATTDKWSECEKSLFALKEMHLDITFQLKDKALINQQIKDQISKLMTILKGINLLKECSTKARDKLLSFGENLSTLIFSELLKEMSSSEVILLDAKNFIKTDSFFGEAEPNTKQIKEAFNNLDLCQDKYFIIQGFIGSNEDGETTTLGRGGSDYTAALIAEATNAKVLQIWTDVDGISTTDPRQCSDAYRIDKLSYKEASELAFLGAKILHPICLIPAKRAKIDVFIGSSQVPSKGTWVGNIEDTNSRIKAIALRQNQNYLIINNSKILKHSQFTQSIFTLCEKYKVQMDCLSLNESSISFSIDQKVFESNSFQKELRNHGEFIALKNTEVISIIGSNLNYKLLNSFMNQLDDVFAMSFGSSDCSVSFCVNKENSTHLINKIHTLTLNGQGSI